MDEIAYHRWWARWRAWRRATRPGPPLDVAANLRHGDSAALLTAWAADLSRRDRRWLSRSPIRVRE